MTRLRHSEEYLSKKLHAKCREVTKLEARVQTLRIRVFELEEAAELSKSKITGLEQRSISERYNWLKWRPNFFNKLRGLKKLRLS